MTNLTRRSFLAGSASLTGLAVSGCMTTAPQQPLAPWQDPSVLAMYRAMPEEQFPIPAPDLKKVPERYYRKQVDYQTSEKVGTLVVDTSNYYLYLVQENGKAMRYGVGLGRAGFEWSGRARIARKAAWPKWTPPEEMIQRQPELEKWSWRNGGMPRASKTRWVQERSTSSRATRIRSTVSTARANTGPSVLPFPVAVSA